MRNAHEILVGKPERRTPFRRPRRRTEDNIEMDMKEIVWKICEVDESL
jgi:hypothetical protein